VVGLEVACEGRAAVGFYERWAPGMLGRLVCARRAAAGGVVVLAAFTVVLATPAYAGTITLKTPVTERVGAESSREYAYVGPSLGQPAGTVGPLASSVDTFTCAGGANSVVTRAIVVPEDTTSVDSATETTLPDPGTYTHSFTARVGSWSLNQVNYRVAASCTDQPHQFPAPVGPCRSSMGFDARCNLHGEWFGPWAATLLACCSERAPNAAEFSEAIHEAFCWKAWPGCPQSAARAATDAPALPAAAVAALPAGNRFTLRNGTNLIALTFFSRGTRPPAVMLKGATGCRAQRMGVSVTNGAGQLRLTLNCTGLRHAGAVRLTIKKAIARSFPLRSGDGKLHIKLDKPPGTVKPYVRITDGKERGECASAGHKLRVYTRRLDLRMSVHCSREVRKGIGHIYVGGLLAADR